MLRRALALGLLALVTAPFATATPPALVVPADTVDDRRPVEIRYRVDPTTLYSGSRGFGLAGGVDIEHLGWNGSLTRLHGRLSQRYQSIGASVYSGNPYDHRVFAGIGSEFRTTTRQRFYGTGPLSLRDAELNLDHASAESEVRLGWYPFGHTGLLLQPAARLLWDRLDGFEEDMEGGLALVDPDDLDQLRALQGMDRYGVSLGLSVSADTRDGRILATRGLLAQAEVRRFFALDGSALTYNQALGSVYGFVPLTRRGTYSLFGRILGGVTREGDGDALPFFYLPSVDDALLPAYPGNRFLGRDFAAAAGGIRFPVARGFGLFELNGLVMVAVGSSYDDITTQFSPRISFDREVVANEDGTVPLRPSLVLGAGLINLDRQRVSVGGKLGIGPEGIVATGLTLVYDIRDTTSLFR